MGRSRSRDRKKKKEKSRSRDRDRKRDRDRDRGDEDYGGGSRKWRFDSPPKEDEIARDAMGLASNPLLNPLAALAGGGLTAMAAQQAAGSPMGALPGMDGMNPAASSEKQSRELYVGNLPAGISTPQLVQFLNQVALAVHVNAQPGDPIVSATMGSGGTFAFVEFRTFEECTNGMKLNGVELLGSQLKVGRPKGSDLPGGPPPGLPGAPMALTDMLQTAQAGGGMMNVGAANQFGTAGSNPQRIPGGAGGMLALPPPGGVPPPGDMLALPPPGGIPDAPVQSAMDQRLCLSNIPKFVTEERIKELLGTFGNLKFFAMQKDDKGKSVGVAFFEFQDFAVQNQAKAALSGLELGSQRLEVKNPSEVMDELQSIGKQQLGKRIIPCRVLYLKGLVKAEDLKSDEEFEEICTDIRLEGEKFGPLVSMEVPRPFKESAAGEKFEDPNLPGVGYAFLEFANVEGSSKAKKGLNGRKFGENDVAAEYFNEEMYAAKDFKDPKPNTVLPQWAKDAQAQNKQDADLAILEAQPEMIE